MLCCGIVCHKRIDAVGLNMRSDFTDEDYSQAELRTMMKGNAAALRFRMLFDQDLMPFIDHIHEVFRPPKSEGVSFRLAAGKRTSLMMALQPQPLKLRGWNDFSLDTSKAKMVPDQPTDPDVAEIDRAWRALSAKASAGFSFREPNSWQSLHIKVNGKEMVDVDCHVDRKPFLKLARAGRPHWDLNPMLNHSAVELVSDFSPGGIPFSVSRRDARGALTSQATVGLWVVVDLPGMNEIGGERNEGFGLKVGFQAIGFFSFLDG